MPFSISHYIHINNRVARKDHVPHVSLRSEEGLDATHFYHELQSSYLKFFKMDLLCKWAWLGAEYLLKNGDGPVYEGLDRNKIGVVLFTANGCLDADIKYRETIAMIPSPALFVYTLPNIMLGEICIRHGFKGEQLCMVQDRFSARELYFWTDDLLRNRNMEACLCGWADATPDSRNIFMMWVTKTKTPTPFTIETINSIYMV